LQFDQRFDFFSHFLFGLNQDRAMFSEKLPPEEGPKYRSGMYINYFA
jgi:hypothetical protein